jgi:2-haloacid dehalogenase
MKLTDFAALTFDCYGTLIDWESGMLAALRPSFAQRRPDLTDEALLEAHGRIEAELESANPKMLYSEILRRTYLALAKESGITADEEAAARYAASLRDWPAFDDTPVSLQYLKRHYKLVILSNVDRTSFAHSREGLGVAFDAVYTAEDIGSYKPDLRNFRTMIDGLQRCGYSLGDILHTAQSLFHDHAPANAVGLRSAWIDRRGSTAGSGATPPPPEGVHWDFRFSSMAELVEAHRAELRG